MKKAIIAAGLLAIAGISTYALAAPKPAAGHYTGEKLARKAKVTIADAEAIALKARHGAPRLPPVQVRIRMGYL